MLEAVLCKLSLTAKTQVFSELCILWQKEGALIASNNAVFGFIFVAEYSNN